MTVAQADKTSRKIIGYRVLDGNKDDETNKRKQHSFGRILGKFALAQGFSSLQS